MSISDKIALAQEMIDSAQASLRSAKQILGEFVKDKGTEKYRKTASKLKKDIDEEEEIQLIEGVFDGQNMIGPDKRYYPVPANYASKSKLIPGDILKLTIQKDGSFIYKQIGPVERKHVTGPLTYEDGQYKVLAEGKAYKVLLASVTYFQGEVGDKITIVIPTLQDSEWGAIENVIPKAEEEEEKK